MTLRFVVRDDLIHFSPSYIFNTVLRCYLSLGSGQCFVKKIVSSALIVCSLSNHILKCPDLHRKSQRPWSFN